MRTAAACLSASLMLVTSFAHAETPAIGSSFKGLSFDVTGVRLDQNAADSLMARDPNFRLKQREWKDSQGKPVRDDIVEQNFATGNIMTVRETVKVSVTPWHSGNLIQQIIRQVAIKSDDQKPTVDDFVAATTAKYGEPSQVIGKGIFGRQATQIRYFIKDGVIANVPCYEPDQSWFNPMTYDQERVTTYQSVLQEIDDGRCDAVLSVFYTTDYKNRERIVDYGAIARDFRVEAASFIRDFEERRRATEERQQATPKGEPKL
ncbi:hypothetical protein PhaeoP83_02661 [Phaeobacter inhibens]|uniref:Uncharacterized protein n=1 Tax=Phaeobacter inhibens TaxID=221822 RepID=A0ABM6RJ05_9RHOB|nr:hypothetical protein [Phaeobacter inhibens]AUQ50911.1 hypothetical protein PhaeoP83_02661 [Phaeobacter inhibens]AUQ96443.1 hypothetical protein PhaeoP66_03713 [Phaeobacter inhibens]AUR20716.1 hypothetical protein PhaeoP80_02661 [Phaeobacter inhibens]